LILHNRPATSLTTINFNTGTRGFAAPEDPTTAVCILPGTELAFSEEVKCVPSGLFGWRAENNKLQEGDLSANQKGRAAGAS
jgi:hypothetical protein